MNKNKLLVLAFILLTISIVAVIFLKSKPAPIILVPVTPLPSSDTKKTLPLQAEYHVNLPNGIILVDAQGRRSGKDPITGIIYREIPGAAYGEDCLSETNCAGVLITTDLPDGQYTFYILGGPSGKFGFSAINNRGLSQKFSGNIQPGTMIVYAQKYESANFASSTIAYKETALSTTSITTEPPRNLPLPVPGQ